MMVVVMMDCSRGRSDRGHDHNRENVDDEGMSREKRPLTGWRILRIRYMLSNKWAKLLGVGKDAVEW